jgi:predicted enzyme related to lactoylglutathione lyase
LAEGVAVAAAVVPAEVKPVRGLKLKHVSTITMVVAFVCLLAYLAGRVDVSAATSTSGNVRRAAKEHTMFLGLRTAKYEVADMAKAKEWYSKVLGIQPYFDEPAFYVGYNVGGYDLGLVPAPKAETKRAAAGVAYWGVEDAHAAYKRLIELGATPVEDVQDVGGGMLVGEVRDPFGNILGIIYNPLFKPGETK